ncbi:MAG: hypothetical protein SF053_14000 [Bacteroidia bacterium]|nr:hypothetical protein [Bacteroidia bacterium]
MKVFSRLIALVFPLLWVLSATGQVSKAEQSVYSLMDAGFLATYKDYRAEIEQYVALFKSHQLEYKPDEVILMRTTYNRTAEAFEDFIYSIRNDMLDRRTRKVISKDSEAYVRGKLEKLNLVHQEYFTGKFLTTYTTITAPEVVSMAQTNRTSASVDIPIALIAPVAQATMQVVQYLDKKGDQDLEQLKKVLEQEWVVPNKFTPWENI